MRTLEELANATPSDYLSHFPPIPVFPLQMIDKASRMFPISTNDNVTIDPTYHFLYVGPGSGNVIHVLIEQGHKANGMESSKRGIMAAPEEIRSYITWCKPWEPPYPSMRGDHPEPFKLFHIGIINKFLKTYYTNEEWHQTVNEIKKLCRVAYTI